MSIINFIDAIPDDKLRDAYSNARLSVQELSRICDACQKSVKTYR